MSPIRGLAKNGHFMRLCMEGIRWQVGWRSHDTPPTETERLLRLLRARAQPYDSIEHKQLNHLSQASPEQQALVSNEDVRTANVVLRARSNLPRSSLGLQLTAVASFFARKVGLHPSVNLVSARSMRIDSCLACPTWLEHC